MPSKKERYDKLLQDLENKQKAFSNPVAYKVYFEAIKRVIYIVDDGNHFYSQFIKDTKKRKLTPEEPHSE